MWLFIKWVCFASEVNVVDSPLDEGTEINSINNGTFGSPRISFEKLQTPQV